MTDFPFVYPEGRRNAGPDDVDASLTALWRSWAVFFVGTAAIALIGLI
jgi:adenosylcobinamide-phosphate synthase